MTKYHLPYTTYRTPPTVLVGLTKLTRALVHTRSRSRMHSTQNKSHSHALLLVPFSLVSFTALFAAGGGSYIRTASRVYR